MPIQAYVDESGGKGQGPAIVQIAVIGSAEEWASFSDEWDAALRRRPAIGGLHMREAASLNGDFLGWTAEERDAKLRSLLSLVNDYSFTGLFVYTDLAAHGDILGPGSRISGKTQAGRLGKTLFDPWYFCFQSMILAVCEELTDRGVTEKFEIIFDDQNIIGPKARQWYPVIRDYWQRHDLYRIMPVDPIFRSDDEFLPLQVSDALAWLFRREISNMPHSFNWVPEAMSGLKWSERHNQVWDRARLEKVWEDSKSETISPEEYRRWNQMLGITQANS